MRDHAPGLLKSICPLQPTGSHDYSRPICKIKMTFVAVYMIAGLIAYMYLFRKTNKEVMPACLLFFGSELGLLLCAILWPVMIPFCLIDNWIQGQEIEEKKNRKEPVQVDLSILVGNFGEALTPQSPTGKVLVKGKEYESRSVIAFIQKGTRIRVVGHSMHYLQIEPADQDDGINSVTSLRDSTS